MSAMRTGDRSVATTETLPSQGVRPLDASLLAKKREIEASLRLHLGPGTPRSLQAVDADAVAAKVRLAAGLELRQLINLGSPGGAQAVNDILTEMEHGIARRLRQAQLQLAAQHEQHGCVVVQR